MSTFKELGIPFKLFDADISKSTNYVGRKLCCLTKKEHDHCFKLGIGDYVRHTCQNCGKDIYLVPIAESDREKFCYFCQSATPPASKEEEAFVSYESIQNGDVVFTKDTEFGMISWEQLIAGWTHGVPGLQTNMLETRENEDEWIQVKLPKDIMQELVKTPDFHTWQGSVWLFHEGRPMTFIGEWNKQDFIDNCPTGIKLQAYFTSLVDAPYLKWEYIDDVCFYLFRDEQTGFIKVNHDMS